MARPTKQGVDYFPFDVYLDDKFKFIEIKCGLEGFAVIVKLLQKVYSYGYWYEWGEDEQLVFAHENRVDCDLLKSVVDEALNRGVFDEGLYEKYAILTSSGIQKRYQFIVKRRKGVEVVREYLLINGVFGDNEVEMEAGCLHDVDIVSTSCNQGEGKVEQSKVDNSKVDNSKVDNSKELKTLSVCDQVKDMFNSIAVDLPEVRVISEARKKAINARVKEHGIDLIRESFIIAQESDFLSGRGGDNWKASFDWIMNPNNFIKVVEGNYINKNKIKETKQQTTTNNPFLRMEMEGVFDDDE